MLFNSQIFVLAFLPAVLAVDSLLWRRGEARLFALIAFSLFFYAWWHPPYLALLLASIVANWLAARLYAQAPRAAIIAVAVALNLLVLGYFKYAGFLMSIWSDVSGNAIAAPDIVLPLAISFFTFHHIAYLIDLRRGEARATSLTHYTLFISFFPHLLAGPIVRYRELIPQFSDVLPSARRLEMAGRGIALFAMGLSKKTLIADELAPVVNQLYALNDPSFAEAWIATLGFTLQIYFDFSGYTDMALGLALMLGFELPVNFASPYRATSLVDFWRRWHMTLSRFLRDYLYIPLGGNRFGLERQLGALLLTMLLGGLWHGAAWTFVLWGALHGAGLVAVHIWQKSGLRMPRAAGWLMTFLFVAFLFVFFRATSIGQGWSIVGAAIGLDGFDFSLRIAEGGWRPAFLGSPARDTIAIVGIGTMISFLCPNSQTLVERVRPTRELALFLGLALAILVVLLGRGAQEFVYFQF